MPVPLLRPQRSNCYPETSQQTKPLCRWSVTKSVAFPSDTARRIRARPRRTKRASLLLRTRPLVLLLPCLNGAVEQRTPHHRSPQNAQECDHPGGLWQSSCRWVSTEPHSPHPDRIQTERRSSAADLGDASAKLPTVRRKE